MESLRSFSLVISTLVVFNSFAQASYAVPLVAQNSNAPSSGTGSVTEPAPATAPAPAPPVPKPARVTVPQSVLPLSGSLDDVPVFNSNSPEIVLKSGVLLSTFPSEQKDNPTAHLNYPLSNRFDIFFHHITNAAKTGTDRTIYIGLLVGNASNEKVHVKIKDAVSYLTKPDSPFIELSDVISNDKGKVFAGPGDRVMLDLLRNKHQGGWHKSLTLAPGITKVIASLPLPVNSLDRPLNGRTGELRLESDGPVYLASLSAFADKTASGKDKKIDTGVWLDVLRTGALVTPRDTEPSVPGAKGALKYGRVAGVASGSSWRGYLTNDVDKQFLSVKPGEIFSYPISTVVSGTLGTNQVQSGNMLVRYPDTAYQAHANYGVKYELTIPVRNDSDRDADISFTFQTPLKDWNTHSSLQFFEKPANHIFFRGTIKYEWQDGKKTRHKLVHLVEKQGQSMPPQLVLRLASKESKTVNVTLLYPADCTPPQVLTISSSVVQ